MISFSMSDYWKAAGFGLVAGSLASLRIHFLEVILLYWRAPRPVNDRGHHPSAAHFHSKASRLLWCIDVAERLVGPFHAAHDCLGYIVDADCWQELADSVMPGCKRLIHTLAQPAGIDGVQRFDVTLPPGYDGILAVDGIHQKSDRLNPQERHIAGNHQSIP